MTSDLIEMNVCSDGQAVCSSCQQSYWKYLFNFTTCANLTTDVKQNLCKNILSALLCPLCQKTVPGVKRASSMKEAPLELRSIKKENRGGLTCGVRAQVWSDTLHFISIIAESRTTWTGWISAGQLNSLLNSMKNLNLTCIHLLA